MPRRKRFTIDDGIYHVMVRGNNRENIFHDEEDFRKYLDILKDNKEIYDFKVYHYVLMDNHIHLILRANTGAHLSKGMRRIGVMYSGYYRRKYKGVGHLFQDRFKSFIVQKGIYLLECGRYVELNPVRAGMIKYPEEYKWSSYRVYVSDFKDEIVDISPEYTGLNENEFNRREIYKDYVEQCEVENRTEERFFREGAYGSKDFIKVLNEKGLQIKWSHVGRPKKKAVEV